MELIEKLKRFDNIIEVLYPDYINKNNYWLMTNSVIIDRFLHILSSEELTSELFESFIFNKLNEYYEKASNTETLYKSLKDDEKSKMTYFFYIHTQLANCGKDVYTIDRKISEKMYSILKDILLKNEYYTPIYTLDDINANNILTNRSNWQYVPFNDNALSYILRHTIGDNKFNYLLIPSSKDPTKIKDENDYYSSSSSTCYNRVETAEKLLNELLALDTRHKICSDVVIRAICDVVLQYSLNAKEYADAIKASNSVIFSSYSNFNILATNKNISAEDSLNIISQSFRQKDIHKYIKSLRESKDMNIISAFLDGGIFNNNRIKNENKNARAMEILTSVLIGSPSRYYSDAYNKFSNHKDFWNKYPELKSLFEEYCYNGIGSGKFQQKLNCAILLSHMHDHLDKYEYFTKFINTIDERGYTDRNSSLKYMLYIISYLTIDKNSTDDRNYAIERVINFDSIVELYDNILKDYHNDNNFKNIFSKFLYYEYDYLVHAINGVSYFFNNTLKKIAPDVVNLRIPTGSYSELYKYLLLKRLIDLSDIGRINRELGYPLKDSLDFKYTNIAEVEFFVDSHVNYNDDSNVYTNPSTLLAIGLIEDFVKENSDNIEAINLTCPDKLIFAPNIEMVGSKSMFYSRANTIISGEITKTMYSLFNNVNKFLYLLDMYLNDFDNYNNILTKYASDKKEYGNTLKDLGFTEYAVTDNWYSEPRLVYFNKDINISLSANDMYNYGMLFSSASIFNKFNSIKYNIGKKYIDFFVSDDFINLCTLEWVSYYNNMKSKGTFNPDFNIITYNDRSAYGTNIRYEIKFNDSYYDFLVKFIKSLHIDQIIKLSGINTEYNEEYVLNKLAASESEINLASVVLENS